MWILEAVDIERGEIIQENEELFKLCFLDYILGILQVNSDVPKHGGLSSPVCNVILDSLWVRLQMDMLEELFPKDH